MKVEYKGWTIEVKNRIYKIIGFHNNKAYALYSKNGTCTKQRDQFGYRLVNEYESDEQALEKAKLYIDMFSERLTEYLNNRINKKKKHENCLDKI